MAARFQGLQIRKLADRSEGERLVRYLARGVEVKQDENGQNYVLLDPAACERILWNPATPEDVNEPWPLAGVAFEGGPPKRTRVPTRFVTRGALEGWIVLEGARIVHRPGGPQDEPWRVTHTFVHADAIVFDTVDGPVRYRVTQNPDKWPAVKNELDEGFGGDVHWFYELELEEPSGG